MKRAGLHAAEHLTECAVQSTQIALERGVPLGGLVHRRILTRMPCSVRVGDLLCEQQEEDVDELCEPTLGHVAAWRYCA
jgi:hypothetical protein